jgi:hypothetical protein
MAQRLKAAAHHHEWQTDRSLPPRRNGDRGRDATLDVTSPSNAWATTRDLGQDRGSQRHL